VPTVPLVGYTHAKGKLYIIIHRATGADVFLRAGLNCLPHLDPTLRPLGCFDDWFDCFGGYRRFIRQATNHRLIKAFSRRTLKESLSEADLLLHIGGIAAWIILIVII